MKYLTRAYHYEIFVFVIIPKWHRTIFLLPQLQRSWAEPERDRLERANIYANDVDRNPVGATKGGGLTDHGDLGYNVRANESLRAKLIPLQGCWTAAMNAHSILPEDSSERPVVYARKSAAPWGRSILPHLLIQPTGGVSTGLQGDFLNELRQAMDNASPFS
ncbi:hypothetical protein SASPL_101806 [Salvia splendens]|uniref:Uncharacterized protein n=1 Tax=Salvia splendens TaxID=180675 RepID=A0A8X9AC87_SALSN|nr:hypothetical protein SASPL_101806 [Salvia splendens]